MYRFKSSAHARHPVTTITSSLCHLETGHLTLHHCQVLTSLVRLYTDNITVSFTAQQPEDYVVIYCGEAMDQLLYRNITRTGSPVTLSPPGTVSPPVNGSLIEGDLRESQIIPDMSESFESVVYSNKSFDLLNTELNFCMVCTQH